MIYRRVDRDASVEIRPRAFKRARSSIDLPAGARGCAAPRTLCSYRVGSSGAQISAQDGSRYIVYRTG